LAQAAVLALQEYFVYFKEPKAMDWGKRADVIGKEFWESFHK